MDRPVLLDYFHQSVSSLESQFTPETYAWIEVRSPVPHEPDPAQEYGLSALYHFFLQANYRAHKDRNAMNATINGGENKLVFSFASPDPTSFNAWKKAIEDSAATVVRDIGLCWETRVEDGKLLYTRDNNDNLLTPLIALAYAKKLFPATDELLPSPIRIPETAIDIFLSPAGLSQDVFFTKDCMRRELAYYRPDSPQQASP